MASISSENTGNSARSPFAGCLIFIVAGVVMVFLIFFSTYVLFRQYAEIEKFTDEKPEPRALIPIAENESDALALAQSIESFRQRIDGDEASELRLAARDINLAIFAYDPLEELQSTFEVIAIHEDLLEIAVSFPLNGKPRLTREGESGWITSDNRYLNATLRARPALLQQELILEILEIHPASGAEVPREFIDLMSPYRITERYREHPAIGPAMAALTSVSVAGGELVFSREPGVDPVDFISDADVDSGARRFFLFFGIGASIFLIFAAVVIFIGLRNARNRNPSA